MATDGAKNQEKSQGQSGQEETPTPNQNQTQAPATPAPAASPPPVRDWLLFMLCWVRCVAPIIELAYGIINALFFSHSYRYFYPGIYFDLEVVRKVTVFVIVILVASFVADLVICLPGGNVYGVHKVGLWCWLLIHVVCLALSSVHLTFVHLYIYNPVALSHYNHTADFDHKWSNLVRSSRSTYDPATGISSYYDIEYRTTPPCQDSKTGKAIMCPEDPVPLPDPYVYAGFLMWFGILFLVIRLGNILFISLLSRVMSKDPRASAPAPAAVGGQAGNSWMRRLSLGFGHPQQPRPPPGQFYPPPGQNQPRYWQQQTYPGPTQYAMQPPGPPRYPMQPQPPSGAPQYPVQPRPLPPGPAQPHSPQPQQLPPPAPPKDVRQSQQQPSRTPYTPSYPPPAEPGRASIATASSPAPEPEGWISGALISSAKPSTASTSASSFPEYFN